MLVIRAVIILAGIISGKFSQLDLVEYVEGGNLAIVIGSRIVDEEALVVDYDETSLSFSTYKKVPAVLQYFQGLLKME
jgi:hypothetical protein